MEQWLKEIEAKENICILFAAETGSRAWGGATEQSDYDVRFIYLYRDLRAYLSLDKPRETLEYEIPYDGQGWELFKALKLLHKSNPSLLEWSLSPIIYRSIDGFVQQLSYFIEESYSLYALFQHYTHLSLRNRKGLCAQKFTQKCQKKLIQSVRAFLLAKLLVTTRKIPKGKLPSIFQQMTAEPLLAHYEQLLKEKREGTLLSAEKINECLSLMEIEQPLLAERGERLPRGKNIKVQLNEWLWELLLRECTYSRGGKRR